MAPRKKTSEEFINQAISKHGKIYDYSKTNYYNYDIKVKIMMVKL